MIEIVRITPSRFATFFMIKTLPLFMSKNRHHLFPIFSLWLLHNQEVNLLGKYNGNSRSAKYYISLRLPCVRMIAFWCIVAFVLCIRLKIPRTRWYKERYMFGNKRISIYKCSKILNVELHYEIYLRMIVGKKKYLWDICVSRQN